MGSMLRATTMRLLKACDHRRMPWKNGGGETIEIAIWPPDASLADFGWRVSMARIAEDGPFSRFPGIDRTLAILSGDGIRLAVDQHDPVDLTAESDPYRFPADAATESWLLGGSVTDLNVMTRRGVWRHTVTRIDPCRDARLKLGGTTTIFVCAGGESTLSGHGTSFTLVPSDALLVDATDSEWEWDAETVGRLYLIRIDPVSVRS